DTVIVSRAGDVIPQITEVLPNLRDGSEKTFQIPQKCPIDGSEIKIEGAIYRCSNPKCGARLRENLDHFVSRSAFNIVGLGQKAIDRFIEDRLIVDQADIFRLSKDEVSELDGFGEKSAIKLISEIKDRKEITLPRFIYSLGILHIGSETSFLLAKEIQRCGARVNKPTDLIEILGSWSEEGLTQIRDIGPRVAESIMDWFSKDSHKKLLKELDDVGISITQENLRVSNKLSGKTFVVTGSLETLSREEVHEKIRNMGGDTSSTVSKSTDYLITGEGGGSKLNKATELGVEIIDEKEFLKMLQ
ncbi:MAG: NAD-dependent DNA ligase LigA, partial [Candidatus Colwellbacteria bacterium CG10_big_fil_rev_8_21_14_0_10_41_28]